MTKLAKALQAAAGNAGAATYVEDVFSTWLYTASGNDVNSIVNGIDLAGEGGLVWCKARSVVESHILTDTENGPNTRLFTNSTAALDSNPGITAFNSNGFSINTTNAPNSSTYTYVSWTFRKAPKFFDVVTFTKTTSSQVINHSLGTIPGCIIYKRLDASQGWVVSHRSITGGLTGGKFLLLDTTDSEISATNVITAADDTTFTVGSDVSNASFVAYLFAHDAGGFGDSGEENVISCGSFTTDGSGNASINIGYEPQWVLFKCSSTTEDWRLMDIMRGMSIGGAASSTNKVLRPNTTDAESSTEGCYPTATGFEIVARAPSQTYIYIAIRRGPMKVPTDGTKVFAPVAYTGNGSTKTVTGLSFSPDLLMGRRNSAAGDATAPVDRLRGVTQYLYTSATTAEQTTPAGNDIISLNMDGFTAGPNYNANYNWSASEIVWSFKRAPSFFDVVCYTGTGSATTFAHNLGVAPEFMVIKRRNGAYAWTVYSQTLGATKYLELNSTRAEDVWSAAFNNTEPTSTVFTVGTAYGVNESAGTYVAYLFATVAGVSKVGSYTGTATTLQINCGFSSGARFVLIKRTDSTGDWYVWDSARGIVAGDDPYLLLNSTAAEVTNTDYVDTYSAGFEISSTAPAAINANGGSFIYLAIA